LLLTEEAANYHIRHTMPAPMPQSWLRNHLPYGGLWKYDTHSPARKIHPAVMETA